MKTGHRIFPGDVQEAIGFVTQKGAAGIKGFLAETSVTRPAASRRAHAAPSQVQGRRGPVTRVDSRENSRAPAQGAFEGDRGGGLRMV